MAPHVRAALAQTSAQGSAQLKPLGTSGATRPVAAHVQAVLGRVAQPFLATSSLAAPRATGAPLARTVQPAMVEMTTFVGATGSLFVSSDDQRRVIVCMGTSSSGRDQLAVYEVTPSLYRKDLLGYLDYEELMESSGKVMSIVKVQSHSPGMGTILAFELACIARGRSIASMVAGMPAHTDDATKYYGGLGFDYRAAEEHERKRREELQKQGLYKGVDLSKVKIVIPAVYALTAEVFQRTHTKVTSLWKTRTIGVQVRVAV